MGTGAGKFLTTIKTLLTMTIREKITSLGYELPEAPAPVGSYVQCVRSGNLLFLSGGISVIGDRKILGKVGQDITIEEGQEAARLCVLNRLAVIEQEIGSLDRVSRIVALNGFVNSNADFYDHPAVMNGASNLLLDIFGEKGKHSRTALGAPALPLNVAVELNLIVEFE